MPEKGGSTGWMIFSLPIWGFGVLVTGVFVGMLLVWSLDGNTVNSFIDSWRYSNDYMAVKFSDNVNYTELVHNLTPYDRIPILSNVSDNLTEAPPRGSRVPFNLTSAFLKKPVGASSFQNLSWISVGLEPNLTSNLLTQWGLPGGTPCRDSPTADIRLLHGLDGGNLSEFAAGMIHEFAFQALDESGNPRCSGGDYFETDLSGDLWKSRPPVKDHDNGTYSFRLQVHPDFAGNYTLTIILLFRHFQGLRFSPTRFAFDKELRKLPVKFYRSTKFQLPDLSLCSKQDFNRDVWSGRWTRHAKNDSCGISDDGRYRCLDPEKTYCNHKWCEGSFGSLESNGWVYSAHCSFRIFSRESAWDCLDKKWIFFWGDSNHVDSIRNLLLFILDVPDLQLVTRRFDLNFTNPRDRSQMVRITNIFNGHWNGTQNYLGIDSLQHEAFRKLLKSYFEGERVPDSMIMNSGLHDGIHWASLKRFVNGAEYAASFWAEVLEGVKKRGLRVPEFIYRTTVATGGYARTLAFNPNKLEAFNGILLEKLRQEGIVSSVIDGFDMTFPWHFDNRCNDGVHYGRAPAKMKWRDGQIGHQYFVDLMLVHVWLNVLCSK